MNYILFISFLNNLSKVKINLQNASIYACKTSVKFRTFFLDSFCEQIAV